MKFLTLVNLTSGPDLDLRKSVLMVNSVLDYFLVSIPLFEVFSVNSGFAANDDPCELSDTVISRSRAFVSRTHKCIVISTMSSRYF